MAKDVLGKVWLICLQQVLLTDEPHLAQNVCSQTNCLVETLLHAIAAIHYLDFPFPLSSLSPPSPITLSAS